MGYNFTTEYKPGKDNLFADALSRSVMLALSSHQSQLIAQIDEAFIQDSQLQQLKQRCIQGTLTDTHFQVKGSSLCYKSKLMVPENPDIIKAILDELHNPPIGGHSGIKRTKARVANLFF